MNKYAMTAVAALSISVMVLTMATPSIASIPSPSPQVASDTFDRIYGATRFETAKAIAYKVGTGDIKDVIIASGNNFQDALCVSVLSKKLNAPVLLVDSEVENSSDAFQFITEKIQKTARIHIIGGTGVVSSDFQTQLNSLGYKNIERIGGSDIYNTDALIAKKLAVAKGTPVVVASGVSFPDALSISSIAAAKGYPIMLTDRDSLSQEVKDFIISDQPSKIYVIGGTAVISDTVQATLTSSIPSCSVERIAGVDRFETNSKILSQFSMNPETVYVASGVDFPDALAGSSLAASKGDPIVLIDSLDNELPIQVQSYFKSLYAGGTIPGITALGGKAVVSDGALATIRMILEGKPIPAPVPAPAATLAVASQKQASRSDSSVLVEHALSLQGVPYVYGGTSRSGFDCSGYAQYVFKGSDISLPRTAAQQFEVGASISREQLQSGDLVFFTTYAPGASHVGIYIGGEQFVHASNSGVGISALDSDYYASRYLGARRVE